jgi:probable phosphoglycerate mutase
MTQLIIARHGNTFAPHEAPRRIGRRTDLPLVEKGYSKAHRLGAYLLEHNLVPDKTCCSTLRRTRQTAQTALDAMQLDQKPDQRTIFDEIDYGPDENMPEDQVRARIGDADLRAWEDNNIVPDGWQADTAQLARNWQDFAMEICKQWRDKTILVVTSGGIARFAPCITGDLDNFCASYTPKLAPGALGILRHDGAQWQVQAWNIRP